MTTPFDDIRTLFAQFPERAPAPPAPPAPDAFSAIAGWILQWRGAARLNRPILCVYAGAHAGGDIGPTRARMEALAAGEAAVNRALSSLGAGLDVFDLALERPVADPALGAAMSERECAATMAFGMEALAKQPDLLILMGIGPGADEAAADLAKALAEDDSDPLSLLRQWGGRETAALAGAILAARIQGVPALLDGAPALAAAAVLHALDPDAIAHCRIAHAPNAPASHALAARLGAEPLLGLQIDLEDGTAAVATLSIVKLAVAVAGG